MSIREFTSPLLDGFKRYTHVFGEVKSFTVYENLSVRVTYEKKEIWLNERGDLLTRLEPNPEDLGGS